MNLFSKKRWRPLLLSAAIFWILVVICLICLTFKEDYPIYVLEDNWTVSINGNKTEDVSLFYFYKTLDGKKLQRGDIVTISTVLPETEEFNFPVILFRSRYTTLDVYLNEKRLYSFGNRLYENEAFIGKMYHFISLPKEYAGKTITFRMKVGENNAFQSLKAPKLGSQPDIQGQFLHENMIIMFTGMFMMVFGVAFLCITMFYVTCHRDQVIYVQFHVLHEHRCMAPGLLQRSESFHLHTHGDPG